MKMNKRSIYLGIITISLISITGYNSLVITAVSGSDDDHCFYPVDMDFQDGAFCAVTHRRHIQWWYFDAVFDNNYSIHVGLMTLSKGHRGLFFPGLNIYKDGELMFHKRMVIPFFKFSNSSDQPFWASEEIPWIVSYGKQVMKAHIDENGSWVYDVSLEIKGQRADLQFKGVMKGWKSDIPKARKDKYYSSWCVPQPKATVKGTIVLDGETINVNGIGYHEHAWKLYTLPQGWCWGKIAGDSMTLTIARVQHSRINNFFLGVLNYNESSYINIDPEKTEFKVTKYKFSNRMLVPTEIIFKTVDEENDLFINITMETVEMDPLGLLTLRYHRQHMKMKGTITIGLHSEEIDSVQIMEVIRFR